MMRLIRRARAIAQMRRVCQLVARLGGDSFLTAPVDDPPVWQLPEKAWRALQAYDQTLKRRRT